MNYTDSDRSFSARKIIGILKRDRYVMSDQSFYWSTNWKDEEKRLWNHTFFCPLPENERLRAFMPSPSWNKCRKKKKATTSPVPMRSSFLLHGTWGKKPHNTGSPPNLVSRTLPFALGYGKPQGVEKTLGTMLRSAYSILPMMFCMLVAPET